MTPGFYTLFFGAGILGDATGAGQSVIVLDGTVTAQDWLAVMSDPPGTTQTIIPPNYNTDFTMTVPAFQILAPVTVKLTDASVISAGSAQIGTAGFIVVRRLA